MTVAQLEQLPQPMGGHFELFQGSLLTVACPRWDHYVCQEKIRAALAAALGSRALVGIEMPFRPLPEHNFFRADVAVVPWERARATPATEYLAGAPDLVVEIFTPPSSPMRARPRRELCLENGCREYWTVELNASRIEVSTAEGTQSYTCDEQIPLGLFGVTIPAASIFADIELCK